MTNVPEGWEIVDNHHLTKTYKFPDFLQALAFVNHVGAISEAANHHPDIE
jgi:4a-hydroxytetrahydrobiopterin dehydratase